MVEWKGMILLGVGLVRVETSRNLRIARGGLECFVKSGKGNPPSDIAV